MGMSGVWEIWTTETTVAIRMYVYFSATFFVHAVGIVSLANGAPLSACVQANIKTAGEVRCGLGAFHGS